MMFRGVDGPHLVHPFPCRWTFGLFPLFGCCEHCHKLACTSVCVGVFSHCSGLHVWEWALSRPFEELPRFRCAFLQAPTSPQPHACYHYF